MEILLLILLSVAFAGEVDPGGEAKAKDLDSKLVDAISSCFDLVSDSVSYSLQQIEQHYRVPYPYSVAVYLGFTLLLLLVASKFFSLFTKSSVTFSGFLRQLLGKGGRRRPWTCCRYSRLTGRGWKG
eukprot:TRINITY_DN8490_c0_g1_i1.p1 TRINITY_DN8490_c0_g1~~TRINITY_DN8490_c0_g1_i1.p1  ORF type:complete len:127 (+),score=13.07 TRINITY_DN8490_c0_g1_i1:140-520(+)